MKSKQSQKAEETRTSIHNAAAKLFADRGYDAVTLREIAKEAGCSHTAIYLYYKDKEDLLQQMALPLLWQMDERMQRILLVETDPIEALKALSEDFVAFCLRQKSMYTLFFGIKAATADDPDPGLEINRLRNRLFGHLRAALGKNFPGETAEAVLEYSRVYFFLLHGIVGTYAHHEEPAEQLLERVVPLLHRAIDITLSGIKAGIGERKRAEAK